MPKKGQLHELLAVEGDLKGEKEKVKEEAIVTFSKKAGLFIYWDVRLQKESANQEARADIEIDGKVMFSDLPVSFLLGMEEELKQLRKVFDAIPTLAPGVEWAKDATQGEDVYKTKHNVEKNKTEKTVQHKVLVPPTKEHPAQVTEWSEDKPVGKYVSTSWSGMVTPFEKSTMLSKLDKMLRAFKKARQRANTQETKSIHVGKEIFDFIRK